MANTDSVSTLNELCLNNRVNFPVYTYLPPSGPPHDPLFICKVEVQIGNRNYSGQGNGPTKKESKKAAARVALLALEGEVGVSTTPEQRLISIAVENGFSVPSYTYSWNFRSEKGAIYKVYRASVKCNSNHEIKTSGFGANYELAKKRAAKHLIEIIQEIITIPPQPGTEDADPDDNE